MLRLFLAALLPSLLALVTVQSPVSPDREMDEARWMEQEQDRTRPEAVVSLVDGDISPESITIRPGQTVRWLNKDNREFSLATIDGEAEAPGELRSGVIKPGRSWDYQFEKEGTFEYRCLLRPRVKGTVNVEAE